MTFLKKFTLGFTGFVFAMAFSTATFAKGHDMGTATGGDDALTIEEDTFEGLSTDLNADISYEEVEASDALLIINQLGTRDEDTDTIKTR